MKTTDISSKKKIIFSDYNLLFMKFTELYCHILYNVKLKLLFRCARRQVSAGVKSSEYSWLSRARTTLRVKKSITTTAKYGWENAGPCNKFSAGYTERGLDIVNNVMKTSDISLKKKIKHISWFQYFVYEIRRFSDSEIQRLLSYLIIP